MKRETFNHPKIYDLASRLNCTRAQSIGHLGLMWNFAADYAVQGDIGRHSDGAIARACDWAGSPEEFINAFVASHWLDRDSQHRLLIHDWSDHCERWIKLKMEKLGLRFAEPSVERSKEAAVETANAASGLSVGPSPPRDSSKPIQTSPSNTSSCSEPSKTPASEPDDDLGPDDPVIMVFPCVGKGPTEWLLRQSKIAEYGESYPGIDVLAECRRALQWLRDNPTRLKTAVGIPKFLNSWLGKAQNASLAIPNGQRPTGGLRHGPGQIFHDANGRPEADRI